MSEVHAPMSPSRLDRIIRCPGSYALCQKAPEQASSSYAEEGTLLHTYAEALMATYTTGSAQPVIEDPEHRAYVHEAVDYVRNNIPWQSAHTLITLEQRVYFPGHDELINGTLDFGAYAPEEGIWIMDYKFGYNEVQPFNNAQLMAYLAGYIEHLLHTGIAGDDVYNIPWYVGIVQPKIDNFSTEIVSKEELAEFRHVVDRTVRLASMPGAPFRASEKACKWCTAKMMCAEFMQAMKAAATDAFHMESDIREGKIPTDEELARVYNTRKFIEEAFKSIETYIFGKLMQNEQVNGFKLVKGRGSRAWKPGTTLDDLIAAHPNLEEAADELVETKLLSPAKVEKYLPAKARDEFNKALVDKKEGNLTMAADSSSKPAVNVTDATSAESAFAGLADEE